MFSHKFTCLLVLISFELASINGQFGGFGGVPFLNAGGASGGFQNSNTNFNQHRGGQFGTIATFGSGGSSTNFNSNNNAAGFSNFGLNRGGLGGLGGGIGGGLGGGIFRETDERVEERPEQQEQHAQMHEAHELRYASPYDEPIYVPKPKPAYKPAYQAPPPPPPVQCPQNLLIGCAPQVQYVPCQPPPLPKY